MARATAVRKATVADRKQRSPKAVGPGRASTQFKKGNPGGKTGRKNRVTVAQRETARQLFTPLADKALKKGDAHLTKCKLDGCTVCFQWAKISFEYAYGKPTQPIEFDAAALRTELESIAAAANKSVEEIEQECRTAGIRVMGDYAVGATG